MRRSPWIIAAALLAAIELQAPGRSRAGEPCGRVVSYFIDVAQGSRVTGHQWRVFDPSRRSDDLFLALPGDFKDVRWDTTFSAAVFRSGDSLYRVDWKVGARPRAMGRLPGAGTLKLATGVDRVALIAWYLVLAAPQSVPLTSIRTGTVGAAAAFSPYIADVVQPDPS